MYASPPAIQPASRPLTQIPDVGRHTTAILRRYPEVPGVMEAIDMQTNEFVGLVQHGLRLPLVERPLTSSRATPESRAERQDADASRRRAAPEPYKPHRYGAGF